MKKILVIIVLFLLVGYLLFSLFYFQEKPKEGICKQFEVAVKNGTDEEQFADTEDIKKYVKEKGLDPTGKQLKDINTNAIEEAILTNQLIKKADVFVTNNGSIKASIEERKPLIRIICQLLQDR
ncbi:MAG: hypothetical protein LBL79_04820 [Prevotella sp.]|jgi:cell division protein FtsQ|nr:hypothetical protein [Prevotella sp.]